MYSQQQQQQAQQNSLLQSNIRQAQADLYSSKVNLPIDPTLFAQHALLQAGIEASGRQQHQQNNNQHQMALAMTSLLGQCTSNPLQALHQRRDLCKCNQTRVQFTILAKIELFFESFFMRIRVK